MKPLKNHWPRATLAMIGWIASACALHAAETQIPPSPALPLLALAPAGGVFASNLVVTISGSTGEVRYTLDGALPATNSALYSAPLLLSNSCRIQAFAFAAGHPTGALAVASFTLLDTNLADFNSSLPLVLLQTFGHPIQTETNVTASVRFIDADTSRRTTLDGPGNFDGLAAVKVRGYTSRRYPKHSLTVELRDPFDHSVHAPLLGMPKDSDWVLYAPYPDKSLMRDVLAYEISNQMGRYASRTRFVEVFLNETTHRLSRAHYAGVYVLEEKIKRGEHRVNVQQLSPEDKAEPAITGGYIFKKDHLEEVLHDEPPPPPPAAAAAHPRPGRVGFPTGPGGFPADPAGFQPPREDTITVTNTPIVSTSPPAAVATNLASVSTNAASSTNAKPSVLARLVASGQGFVSSRTNAFFYVDPKAKRITPGQRAWLSNYVNRFEQTLDGPDFRNPITGYPAFIDSDSFIDHHLIVEATKNIDGFRFSTFYSKERDGKINMEPIWDWNLAFGNASGRQGDQWEHWYWPQLDDRQYSWFRRLFDDPEFGQRYVDRWAELRSSVLATSNLVARVNAWAALLKDPAARNFERWPILGQTINTEPFAGKTFDEEILYLKGWISNRLAWVGAQFVPPPVAQPTEPSVASGTALVLTSAAGRVYFTLDGTDPRLPGGAVSPVARGFEQPLSITNTLQIFARTQMENRWSSPLKMKITVKPTITAAKGV